jgi:hypothetical protein
MWVIGRATERLFQARNVPADRGLPHAEHLGSRCEAAAVDDGQEGAQQVDVQIAHHGS